MGKTIIITRHKGMVDWLKAKGITGDVIAHATPDDIKDKHVIGTLPLYLAALAASITTVDMPALDPALRGTDLSPADMDKAGAKLTTYVVSGQDTPANNPLAVLDRVLSGLGYTIRVTGHNYSGKNMVIWADNLPVADMTIVCRGDHDRIGTNVNHSIWMRD